MWIELDLSFDFSPDMNGERGVEEGALNHNLVRFKKTNIQIPALFLEFQKEGWARRDTVARAKIFTKVSFVICNGRRRSSPGWTNPMGRPKARTV